MITQAIDLYFSFFVLHSYSLEMLMIRAHMHDVLPPIHYLLYCIFVVSRLKLSHSGFTSISNLFFRAKLYSSSKPFSLSGYFTQISSRKLFIIIIIAEVFPKYSLHVGLLTGWENQGIRKTFAVSGISAKPLLALCRNM